MASRRGYKGNKVDVNMATVDELAKLNGIGRTKAEAIVEQRQALGSFSSVRDLLSIPGIGRSLLDQNRNVLMCSRQPHMAKDALATDRETRSQARAETIHSSSSTESTSSGCAKLRAVDGKNSAHNNKETSMSITSKTAEKNDEDGLNANESGDSALIEDDGTDVESDSVLHGQQDICEECGEERMDCVDGVTESDDEEKEECSQCGHRSVGTDGQEEGSRMLRSRLGSTSEKHWMKRKCEGSLDTKAVTPGKKCRSSSEDQTSGCSCGTDNIPSSSALPGISRQAMRKRITSRTNPPPELADWIKTFQSWSSAERLVALDEMIEVCEPTQVRHMMSVIEPQFQRDFISLLPKELALYVLSFLEPRDLLRAAQTCRYWRILAEDNLLWREKCREEAIDDALVFGNRMRRRSESSSKSPCKSLYMRQKTIEYNWRAGELRPPKVLKGHDDHVITCLEFCGGRIVSGSDDNTLKVWSAVTGKCLRTLVGHTGGVWSSQMSGNLIISGSTDRTLKVWNADTGQCIHTLYGHTSTVRCMHLHGDKVVSGSRDATLRMWDMDSGQCLHVLMGHVAAVRCVQYDGRRVVSGAYDYMVKIWDPETETCLHTLQGHTNRVYSLQFDGVRIVSGSLDTSIRVWDVESGNCLHTLIGHQSLTSGMELKDNLLVSGNADSTVKVWDITTGQCLQTLQGPNKHLSAVTCLQFNKRFVITSSDDGSVKIWDVKSGEFLRNLVALDSGGSGGVVWRIRCNNTKLVCAVGSRNGTEETKLMVLDFDVEDIPASWGSGCCTKAKATS